MKTELKPAKQLVLYLFSSWWRLPIIAFSISILISDEDNGNDYAENRNVKDKGTPIRYEGSDRHSTQFQCRPFFRGVCRRQILPLEYI